MKEISPVQRMFLLELVETNKALNMDLKTSQGYKSIMSWIYHQAISGLIIRGMLEKKEPLGMKIGMVKITDKGLDELIDSYEVIYENNRVCVINATDIHDAQKKAVKYCYDNYNNFDADEVDVNDLQFVEKIL